MTVNKRSAREVEVKIDLRRLLIPLHCPRASAVGRRRAHRPGPHPNHHALRRRRDIYVGDLVAITAVPDVMDNKLFAVRRRFHAHDGRVVKQPEPRIGTVNPAGRVECKRSCRGDRCDAHQSDHPSSCHPRDGTARVPANDGESGILETVSVLDVELRGHEAPDEEAGCAAGCSHCSGLRDRAGLARNPH